MFIGITTVDVPDTPVFINTSQITSFVIKTKELTMSDGNTYELKDYSFKEVLDVIRSENSFLRGENNVL